MHILIVNDFKKHNTIMKLNEVSLIDLLFDKKDKKETDGFHCRFQDKF